MGDTGEYASQNGVTHPKTTNFLMFGHEVDRSRLLSKHKVTTSFFIGSICIPLYAMTSCTIEGLPLALGLGAPPPPVGHMDGR